MDIIPPEMLKEALKQYRKDVPSMGRISYDEVEKLLSEDRTCRGWTTVGGREQYFHIIKSPTKFPEKSAMFADSEKDLFQMTVHLGMQHEIDLDDLVKD